MRSSGGQVHQLVDAEADREHHGGCGRSQRRGPYTLARFIADLDTVRDRLGGPAVNLLGHSWGATLALLYTLRHPDRVSRLVYVRGTGIDPTATRRTFSPSGRSAPPQRPARRTRR
jgi:proline iminopeptidase